ncbi:GntR family transcriptional regulator [Balneola sp. MJW-20]|uniref:GntR family transcriptional regulator n=1 Tax=Gracilimonas aurantiaca TaxID=3234185 RepID=UPI0034651E3A
MSDLKKGIPLHKQISDWLRDKIETGSLKRNEKLPSESQLSDKFDVSRVTVRRALQTLENEQVIYRCQGLGSFVSDQRSHHPIMEMRDFMEEMAAAGLEGSSEVVSFKQEIPNEKVYQILEQEPGKKLTRLDRVRLANGEPVAFDVTWLPVFYGQLLQDYDLADTTIFKILEEEYDIPVLRGCYRLEAENADKYVAKHLHIPVGQALTLINRISYTVGDKPVYYQKRYYRSDKVTYQVQVSRGNEVQPPSGELPVNEFRPTFNL